MVLPSESTTRWRPGVGAGWVVGAGDYTKLRAVAKPPSEDFLTTLEVLCRQKIGEVLQAVLESEVEIGPPSGWGRELLRPMAFAQAVVDAPAVMVDLESAAGDENTRWLWSLEETAGCRDRFVSLFVNLIVRAVSY